MRLVPSFNCIIGKQIYDVFKSPRIVSPGSVTLGSITVEKVTAKHPDAELIDLDELSKTSGGERTANLIREKAKALNQPKKAV